MGKKDIYNVAYHKGGIWQRANWMVIPMEEYVGS